MRGEVDLIARCLNTVSSLRSRRGWLAVGAALLALALGLAGWWSRQASDQQERARADSLAKAGRFAEALPLLQRQHRRQPNDLTLLRDLATCLAAVGRLDDASALLLQANERQPSDAGVLLELGRLSLERGDAAEAEAWLGKALAVDPTDRRSNHMLLQSLRLQGKETAAKDQLAKFQRLLADLARATEIMNDALKERPNDPDLHLELGVLLLRNGQTERGLQELERAVELEPRQRAAHAALADYYEKHGQPERAVVHRRALRKE